MTTNNNPPCTRVLISYFADGRVLSEELADDDLVIYKRTVKNVFIQNSHQDASLDEPCNLMGDAYKDAVKRLRNG